jgi:hypothetical protein
MKTMQTMKLKVTSLLLGFGLAVLGPAARTAHAQYVNEGNVAASEQFSSNQTDVFTINLNGQLEAFLG